MENSINKKITTSREHHLCTEKVTIHAVMHVVLIVMWKTKRSEHIVTMSTALHTMAMQANGTHHRCTQASNFQAQTASQPHEMQCLFLFTNYIYHTWLHFVKLFSC